MADMVYALMDSTDHLMKAGASEELEEQVRATVGGGGERRVLGWSTISVNVSRDEQPPGEDKEAYLQARKEKEPGLHLHDAAVDMRWQNARPGPRSGSEAGCTGQHWQVI